MRWSAAIMRTPGEIKADRAFAEQVAPGRGVLTYSDLLDDLQCVELDRAAYAMARTWYLRDDGDPTLVHGVSLGKSFELPATLALVRVLRARVVLAALRGGGPVALAGVGTEWEIAAAELGIPVTRIAFAGAAQAAGVPDGHLAPPDLLRRGIANLLSRRGSAPISFLGSPKWADPYIASVPRSSLEAINPGRRTLLRAARPGGRGSFTWLADALGAESRTVPGLAGTGYLADALRGVAGRLADLVASPIAHRARVLVATEDVSPSARATVLATRAAGGRTVTLEHGVAGTYPEQVHSVADVLAVWGRPHVRYHTAAGRPGQRIVPVGWPHLAGRQPVAADRAAVDAVFFGQPVPSLSTANWPEDVIVAAEMVGAYARSHPGRSVTWKPHPASAAYGGAFDPGPGVRPVTGTSLELIARSRVVIVRNSTTAIEAMALGRPVVQLIGRGQPAGADFVAASGAATSASSAEELADAVERLAAPGPARERAVADGRAYAREFILGLDERGSAERRLAEIIAELAAAIG